MGLAAILFSNYGCKEYGRDLSRRSYAMYFYEMQGIELTAYPEYPDMKTVIVWQATSITAYGYKDTGERRATYDALCAKYGDMSYNREEFVPIGEEPSFLAYSPVSIEIVSDVDFDDEHPAGTSLADIVTYDGHSSKPFIDSGYQPYYWEDMDRFHYYEKVHERPYYPVNKKVSELTVEDLMLVYGVGSELPWGHLYFQVPTLSQTHNIKVTLTDERGKKFSDTITMNFE
jgi:hypothetical protein